MDPDRLRKTLGDPGLQWLLTKLIRRLERGRPLQGAVTLQQLTAQQREVLGRLLGRGVNSGPPVVVNLKELEQLLVNAGVCSTLRQAVETLSGPIANRRQHAIESQQAWARLFRDIESLSCDRASMKPWIQDLERSGLLLRLSGKDLETARSLLERATEIVAKLPAQGITLAELAASCAGDSHALDLGSQLSALVLRWVKRVSGIETFTNADERRTAWASVGILCDELSAPLLILNLRASGNSTTATAMNIHAEKGEPYRMSTRQLLRDCPDFVDTVPNNTVFVCENPAIVASVANRLGPRSAPLISIEGQPKTAAHLLLKKLQATNMKLFYHGDFDWAGVRIGNLMLRRYGVTPWRFSLADYLSAPKGRRLHGISAAADWDSKLANAMMEEMRSVHEEAVVDCLAQDLSS
jgi:uncharacterized protein (TIGR02679 family)